MNHQRYLFDSIRSDLKKKMVFIGGPRQVGKTTFALSLIPHGTKDHPAYLNWDFPNNRKKIQAADFPEDETLLIFDEIHKFKRWRNLVKGIHDQLGDKHRLVVTGSARLDYYSRGGDSLLGRYHYYRLHPFTLRELSTQPNRSDLELLIKFGGFPEPLFSGEEKAWRRWHLDRSTRVIDEDIRDLENVREISLLRLLVDQIHTRVGSPLSLQSLRKDLEVSHDSIRKWVDILDNVYFTYRIPPYGVSSIKAVKKEQKLYLWDWSQVEESGYRFENLVASHLLKYCHYQQDSEGYKMELKFIRDTEKREVDFVVIKDSKPLFAVECKSGERNISSAIEYFATRTPIPVFYQVHLGQTHKVSTIAKKTVEIIPFLNWVKKLELP